MDWELSQFEYLGDSFPYVNFDAFGPGILAAFLGAKLDNSTGGVWFHPDEDRELDQIHLRFDEENIWFRRIMDLYKAGLDRWDGQVHMVVFVSLVFVLLVIWGWRLVF